MLLRNSKNKQNDAAPRAKKVKEPKAPKASKTDKNTTAPNSSRRTAQNLNRSGNPDPVYPFILLISWLFLLVATVFLYLDIASY